MIRLSVIIAVLGSVIRAFGMLMALPLVISALYFDWYCFKVFLGTGLGAMLCGHGATRAAPNLRSDDLERLEGMGVVAFGWFFVSVFGAIPYLCFGHGVIDAMFESMSGFTTTGATIFTDFTKYTPALFFYRGFTHWLGGLGILVLFVAILPHLAVAGRQLFFAETSAASKETLTPRIRDTAQRLWGFYVLLTLIQALLLYIYGMPINDALANSFATLAAGGFSPNPESIMGYKNPAAEWIIILFMFLAGANFTLQVRVLRGNLAALLRNAELRFYLLVILASTFTLFLILGRDPATGFSLATIRTALFQNLSILTTTGFATVDFAQWSDQAKAVLLMLMFIGGCSGSAGGGIKVIRVLFLLRYMWRGIFRAIHPRAVVPVRIGDKVISDQEVQPLLSFTLIYVLVWATAGATVTIIENNLTIGFTGAIATLGNIGPGFGIIGPMGSFASLHPMSKMIFFVLMWAGRLEIVTLAVFLRLQVWRNARW